MAAPLAWETLLRAGGAQSLFRLGCRRGWSVANQRGLVRLNITAHAGGGHRCQLLLPIPWDGDHVNEVRDALVALHSACQDGEELEDALTRRYPGQKPLSSTVRASSTSVCCRSLQQPFLACPGGAVGRTFQCRSSLCRWVIATDTVQWAARPGCLQPLLRG